MTPSLAWLQEIFAEHRGDADEDARGYWQVRCACGWRSVRSTEPWLAWSTVKADHERHIAEAVMREVQPEVPA